MSPQTGVPAVLGLAAEQALRRETDRLQGLVDRLSPTELARGTPAGSSVAHLVHHLTEGLDRAGAAWRRRLDPEPDPTLLHTFDQGQEPAEDDEPTPPPEQLRARYRDAARVASEALSSMRQDDWTWPMWSPLGGVESLAEAVRRTMSHHHVHADDIARGLERPAGDDEPTEELVVEFVLDAIARRGADAVEGPMVFTVVTGLPGAGTWSIVLHEPAPREDLEHVMKRLLQGSPPPLSRHRVERGSRGDARATVRGHGDSLWRAAFARDAAWEDLDVHGDDEARDAWSTMIAAIAGPDGGLGRLS